jgi:hypothetical protein
MVVSTPFKIFSWIFQRLEPQEAGLGWQPQQVRPGEQMERKRNLVHWSILALRNCRTTLCVAAFNTFSSADGDFANFGGKFLPPIPTKPGRAEWTEIPAKTFLAA